ncbi:DctP family TRAP transporter solute-binding subunit [Rhizobiales bacterium RZME27]|jgi:tripartite ATP-independent transporter DctP family solute receptor|uniref:DctP family TRAP transporter solute-binding subunit n=1 Tax=Endobacterium cereale TaxID=2663029 RepID=A0A6A8A892_9HYPH|nr:TRAP transporter substrate-binding protein [Endobacterium cereale]MEB2844379.1 TRAP transporter substrate-binding protein [Endobacterium cereale]MQY46969.1 DctP family TRAP transporter solute-binding subunit [Endobacterium cereale]
MKFTSYFSVIAGAVALSTISPVGISAAFAAPVVFEIAFNQPETHPQFKALQMFAEGLKNRTNGEYSAEVFPNELLGAQKETVEMTQTGTVAMSVAAASLLESWNPDFSVFNLPYLFNSIEEQKDVLNNPEIVGDLYNSVTDQSVIVLGSFTAGARSVYLKDRFVKTPADLAGKKIRVMQSDTNVQMMKHMGGVGIAMGQGEVYTAIQTGVLDGGENNEIVYSSLKHAEVAPYFSNTRHLMIPDYLVMNVDLYKELPDGIKTILKEELAKAFAFEFDAFAADAAKARADAEKAGAKFSDDVDMEAFRAAVKPLVDSKLTNDVTKSIYQKIEALR